MDRDTHKPVLQTLAFFDAFSMPLTKPELKRFLYTKEERILWNDIEQALGVLVEKGSILFEDGYYRLSDSSSSLIEKRNQSKQYANDLFKQSKNWLSVLASFPGVESIAICNNLGFLNASDNSDIDLFIITKPGQLWQTRFFLASLLHVFKKRPTEENHYGKFCLSFLISSDALSISEVLLEEDPYFEYWFTSLLPVYDPKGILPQFMQENKQHWKHIGVMPPLATRELQQKESLLSRILHTMVKPFSGFFEQRTKDWQQKRFPQEILAKLQEDQTDVVVSNTMLKFHTTDRRRHYREQWKARLESLNN